MSARPAYLDALHLLSRRDLTVAECRARLLDRDHPPDEVERAIGHLLESRGLDDARVARAHAKTAAGVKGRGRHRVARELAARGIDRDVVAQAVGEVFGEIDERALVAKAIERKLRGRRAILSQPEQARLYQHLLRQGFSPGVVSAALRDLRRGAREEP